MLLRIEKITKAYGDNHVLDGISLHVDDGQHIGLVGANGVGKTTLLRIILGQEEADSGTVWRSFDAAIGYLAQSMTDVADQSIASYIDGQLGGLKQMERDLRQMERTMATATEALDRVLRDYATLTERYERRGGYDLEHRRAMVFAGLNIDALPETRPLDSLSGGEKMRVGLAALLLRTPDLLVLDEPTNHLDFAALAWLEDYLHRSRSGMIVVSHDRHFLNSTVDCIVEIAEHSRTSKLYIGNYDGYAARKHEERLQWEEAYQQQQEEIWALRRTIKSKARQVAHNRPPKDGTKDMAYNAKGERVQEAVSRNVHSAEEKLARLEADAIPRPPRPLRFNPEFGPESLFSRSPLSASGITKQFGDVPVLSGIDLTLQRDSRIVIVGPNGSGKSTLLRILAGRERADEGKVAVAPAVIVGYLDQEQETLDERLTLFEHFREEARPSHDGDQWETLKAELLGLGLFVYDDLGKGVSQLSIGQKRKLQIAGLIAARANLLLLDEPTNHVSLDVLEEFERALVEFQGPVIAVSHDRHFIQRFATEVWQMTDGQLHVSRIDPPVDAIQAMPLNG